MENKLIYEGSLSENINVTFKGTGNILKIDKRCNIISCIINFFCNDSIVEIGSGGKINVNMQLGEKCKIKIGNNVYFTSRAFFSAAEYANIIIGNQCMIAANVKFRNNDAHPIFDIEHEKRVNESRHIEIEDHVWIGEEAAIFKGSHICSGSVIGFRSLVCGYIPNNCVAAGSPARVIKKDIAWEPPHLIHAKPFFKPDASCVQKSQYWSRTDENKIPQLPLEEHDKGINTIPLRLHYPALGPIRYRLRKKMVK